MKKFNTILLAAAFALLSCVTCSANESVNWGLSYPSPGKTPVGNADASFLKKYDGYFIGNTDEKVLYLTFDAGYEAGHTEKILDVLKKTQVPAAFFLVGTYIRDNPELTARMVSEGHIVGNHTMSHPDMSAISDMAVFKNELAQTEDLYKGLTGTDMPRFYRPPRGIYSTENLEMARELGYKTVFWSLAYVDWVKDKQPSREEAFSKLIPRVHPGAVILLHNTSQTNADILEELIGKYREMGYEFRCLTQLIEQS